MKKIIDVLPLAIFIGLVIVLFSFLSEKDSQLETVLIDSSFPIFFIPARTFVFKNKPRTTIPKSFFI